MTVAVNSGAEADSLLREAHAAAYRHPGEFCGFTAALVARADASAIEGRVTVVPGVPPVVELDEGELANWVAGELASMAAHRWHREYADGDGRHGKQLGPDDGHPLGRLVVLDDAMHSSFRVADGQITEITRTHGGARFTIVIQERVTAPDGRSVSSSFTVFYWDDESGRLTRADSYRDTHVASDGLLLPAFRQVVTADDTGRTVRRLELSQHELVGVGS